MKKWMVLAVLFIVIGLVGSIFTYKDVLNQGQERKVDSIHAEGIDRVFVQMKNSIIVIEETEGEDIIVQYAGDKDTDKLVIAEKNKELSIRDTSSSFKFVMLNFFTKENKLTISLPKKVYQEIKVKSKNGAIHAEGVELDLLDIHTANGMITAKEITGDVAIKSANGMLKAEKVSGDLTAQTANGVIRLEEISGDIRAKADNGAISYEGDKVEQNIRLTSSNGSITLNILDLLDNVTLDLKTEVGSVRVNGEKDWRPVIGDGKYDVILKTSVGSVKINDSQKK